MLLITNYFYIFKIMKDEGKPWHSGKAVELLCDHEVMGSSPENSLLQKCR
jgi:hypothetical protein